MADGMPPSVKEHLTLHQMSVFSTHAKGTAMFRLGNSIARMIAPAFDAGRVRHCVSISKTTAKTTTKTV
ncbi:hypothetical protein Q9314_10735 [Shinella sumterensis]|nr:hypothetical protein Q9314_10735 [Shinella sumterensis]